MIVGGVSWQRGSSSKCRPLDQGEVWRGPCVVLIASAGAVEKFYQLLGTDQDDSEPIQITKCEDPSIVEDLQFPSLDGFDLPPLDLPVLSVPKADPPPETLTSEASADSQCGAKPEPAPPKKVPPKKKTAALAKKKTPCGKAEKSYKPTAEDASCALQNVKSKMNQIFAGQYIVTIGVPTPARGPIKAMHNHFLQGAVVD
eukprot:TRINITY_DN652_c0_g2_i2.p1 TRINITY_DN652_c0_g2~~TRINITY_DN652_c0_g2_i2.p1  ORF type:complete len:200 (-),score=45.74 TRINITY_DN652_c0_g2_i2:887-1486(-)